MIKSQTWFIRTSFLSLLLFFFGLTSVTAQNKNLDSLKTIISSRKHDTIKLKAISFVIINTSNTSSEYGYYNDMFKMVALRILKNKKLDVDSKQRAYDALGTHFYNKAYQSMQSDYLLTIKYLNKSLEYYNPKHYVAKYHKASRAYVLMSLGVMYNKIGNTSQSIHNYFEALHIFEEFNDKSSISYAFQSIANLYFEQKKFNDALHYYTKAYTIYYKRENLSFQDKIQKALLFVNIGKTYQELQSCEQSKSYLNKALTIAMQINDNDVLSEIYFNFGRNEEKCKNNLNLALSEYQKSLDKSNLPENNTNSLIAIGSVLMKQNKLREAEQYLSKGLKAAKKINHLEYQKTALDNLYLVYKNQKQFSKALNIIELSNSIKDSIKKEQNNNLLTKKQLQYEYEAKQSQLKLMQERKLNTISLENQKKNAYKNNLLIGLTSLLLIILIGVYFFYRNYKQKQAISVYEKNELNQKLLLMQMNPHFIFNSIDTIQILIRNQQNNEAVSYLNKFSKLTRQILENSSENYISLDEELTMIDNYLVIQQLLYNNKFEFKIDVAPSLPTEMILLPPMLTQPFIENAIKHGLRDIYSNGMITIRFQMLDSKLFFEVIDNGSGFSFEEKEGKNKSLAMKITKERLKSISKKNHFEVQTENVLDENAKVVGAKVYFEIPYIYEN